MYINIPVSYTHLDVYKRQVLYIIINICMITINVTQQQSSIFVVINGKCVLTSSLPSIPTTLSITLNHLTNSTALVMGLRNGLDGKYGDFLPLSEILSQNDTIACIKKA